jgi:hypothetical protein
MSKAKKHTAGQRGTTMTPVKDLGYTRLPDGRILWMRGDRPADWLTWDPDARKWVPATRIHPAALFESHPLTAEEVQRLTSESADSQ